MREIILDLETTGLDPKDGHRMTEIGMLEMVDGKLTGNSFHSYLNPERDVPAFITELTQLTYEFLSDKPKFYEVAKKVRDFIGDSPVVITCRVSGDYTLDIAFLNFEFENSGLALKPIPASQWVNVRLWGQEMFGYDEAKLDAMVDRYNIDRSERIKKGHGALLDAQLLAAVYPKLIKDYKAFKTQKESQNKKQVARLQKNNTPKR